MARKQVFVLWSNPLFLEAVNRLLKHPDINTIGSAQISSISSEEFRHQDLETVIFEKTGSQMMDEVIKLLLLGDGDLRLIGFNLEDNQLSIFQREHRTVLKANEFVELVLH